MRSRSARGIVPVVFATSLLIVACASGPRIRHKHEYTLSPGQEYHPGLAKALLVPIDSTNEKPVKGLDIANDRITALIVSHLESKGLQVEKAAPGELKRATDEAYETVRDQRTSGASGVVASETDFGDMVPAILEELEKPVDLVIVPNLVMRTGLYQGPRTLVWDGVRRREKAQDLDFSSYDAPVPVASIQMTVFAKDGTQVFSGFGGLEAVFEVDRAAEEFVQREDLFKDTRNLHEGICVAFYPYFGMDEYCSR